MKMFKRKRNKNSKQNLEIAKEFGRNKVNKEDDTVSNSGGDNLNKPRRRSYDDYDFEFGDDYVDNFFTSDYERQNYYREIGKDDITNLELGKEDCCKEK
jgi:hypothetical protein